MKPLYADEHRVSCRIAYINPKTGGMKEFELSCHEGEGDIVKLWRELQLDVELWLRNALR